LCKPVWKHICEQVSFYRREPADGWKSHVSSTGHDMHHTWLEKPGICSTGSMVILFLCFNYL
jgi:hypothetical protein